MTTPTISLEAGTEVIFTSRDPQDFPEPITLIVRPPSGEDLFLKLSIEAGEEIYSALGQALSESRALIPVSTQSEPDPDAAYDRLRDQAHGL